MIELTQHSTKPSILVSDIDYKRLSGLAAAAGGGFADIAEELQIELERARVAPAAALPADVVRMGSTVEFRSDDGQQKRVTLVFPGDANIAEGRISILTPIGVALIGLSAGQSMTWLSRDGRKHELTVIGVEQCAVAPADHVS